jgi:hypothetical protein
MLLTRWEPHLPRLFITVLAVVSNIAEQTVKQREIGAHTPPSFSRTQLDDTFTYQCFGTIEFVE